MEFALVLPLLMLLTFGIIEFSILLFDKAVITNASREGARAGIVFAKTNDVYTPKTDTEIKNIVKSYANSYLINLGTTKNTLADGDIVITPATRTSKDDLTVTVNFTYNFLVFPNLSTLFGSAFNGTKTLVGKTVMRME